MNYRTLGENLDQINNRSTRILIHGLYPRVLVGTVHEIQESDIDLDVKVYSVRRNPFEERESIDISLFKDGHFVEYTRKEKKNK